MIGSTAHCFVHHRVHSLSWPLRGRSHLDLGDQRPHAWSFVCFDKNRQTSVEILVVVSLSSELWIPQPLEELVLMGRRKCLLVAAKRLLRIVVAHAENDVRRQFPMPKFELKHDAEVCASAFEVLKDQHLLCTGERWRQVRQQL